MRKGLVLSALGVALSVVLTACAPAPPTPPWGDSTEPVSKVKACLVSDQAGFSDKSFNQSAKEGLDRAVAELNIRSATTESKGPGDFKQNIDNLLAQNCTLVFGVAYTLNDAIRKAAEANPDIRFVLIDSRITQGNPPVEVSLPNAKSLVFNTAEASFLAGYLAAGMSQTGVVGTWGGLQIPPVALFMDGFAAGVERYNQDRRAQVRLIGWNKETQAGSFAGGFQDQGKGRELTQGMISQRADIIMPVAGNAGNGALAAAKTSPGTAIVWVDFDGYLTTGDPQLMLTSVLKNVGQGVYDTIVSELDGTFSSEAYIGTLENGGVDIAPFHDFDSEVPDALRRQLDALRQKIVAGEITIETRNQP